MTIQACNQDILVFLIFRDIAARTCLLSSDLTAKIGDCGAAETLYKVIKTTIMVHFTINSNKNRDMCTSTIAE